MLVANIQNVFKYFTKLNFSNTGPTLTLNNSVSHHLPDKSDFIFLKNQRWLPKLQKMLFFKFSVSTELPLRVPNLVKILNCSEEE